MWTVGLRLVRLDEEERRVLGTTMIGYLPVYDSDEEALKDYPEGPLGRIQVREGG